ncbi:MAG TPA: Rpn family recombination-promoting nuclease/putative transposase [Planctomycetota bacterium]|nr:Rpn family recombination-promoting nuclease/putative transposase [Planctomycetota bacterium]
MGTPTPHDTWFHFAHRHPRHAAGWLRSCLPAALVAVLDWSTLRLCSERVHGLGLRLGVTDIVYEVHMHGAKVRALVIVEHHSSRDRRLHDQVLRYSVYLAHGTRRRRSSPHAPVIAVVLHHGQGPPDLRPDLPAGIDELPAEAARLVEEMQPRLRCVTDNLSERSEAWILARGLTPLCTLNHLSLRFLRHFDPAQTIAALERWGPLLRAVDTDDGPPIGRDAIAKFGWYLLHVTETPVEDVHMALEKHLQREENTFMSTAEKLRREGMEVGIQQGLTQGLSQGLTQGLSQGRTETLLRQLNHRFGPLSPAIEHRLRTATTAELDRWTERILDCATLDAVFAED